MSFKDNLKKKILIHRLSKLVAPTIGSPRHPRKVDKESMRRLLALSPFVMEKQRDLELYFRGGEPEVREILVLDNELPLYGNTSLDDVALRRSPELKEMLSIRNIIKILDDSDILICRGEDTLRYVRDRALELLDLHFEEKDIEEIATDGVQALATGDVDAVVETLDLFVDLLAYVPMPETGLANGYIMYGNPHREEDGKKTFGPLIMYNSTTNTVKLLKANVSPAESAERDLIRDVALGEVEPDEEGHSVFRFLKEEVLKNYKACH